MRINLSNSKALEKVVGTIKIMEEYKKQLHRFASSVSGNAKSDKSRRPQSLLLTHFTGNEHAQMIVRTQEIKLNPDNYISFTELNPFEFNTITQKPTRRLGFGFFKKELLDRNIDLFVPMAFAEQHNHDEILQLLRDERFRKYVVESSASGQPSILFSNMLEVRSSQVVPLELCRLFFRNHRIGQDLEGVLSDLGIFQLPHRVLWYSDFFLRDQVWVYKEESDHIVFYDNKSPSYTQGERVISSKELISKIEAKRKNNS